MPPIATVTPLRAAFLMLGSALFFGLMAICIRLASSTIETNEIAFFRSAFGLLALLPIVLRGGKSFPRTQHLPRYLLRTAIGFLGMLCGFWAIGHLPLSQAISLSYSTPLFVTIGAVILLGETVRLHRWSAVVIGFVGVLTILRPGSSAFSLGMLVAIAAAVLSALVAIQMKQLSKIDPPDTVVFYTYVFWVPMSLIVALAQWRWPQGITWLWLAGCGIFGTIAQLLWARALKLGDVSALQPISFMQLPFVIVLGWWLFDEHLDLWTAVGAAIIFASTAYIARRASAKATNKSSEALSPKSKKRAPLDN